MPKLGLFSGTVVTKETIEPNDGDLLGALLFGCIVFFCVVCNLCLITFRRNPSVLKQKLPYEDDFLLYHFHYFATYYNMFDRILK